MYISAFETKYKSKEFTANSERIWFIWEQARPRASCYLHFLKHQSLFWYAVFNNFFSTFFWTEMIHQAVFWCFGTFHTLVFTHSRVLPLKQAFLSSTYCTEANKEPINLGHIIQKWKALAINHASSCKPEPSPLARRSPKKCAACPYCVARVL